MVKSQTTRIPTLFRSSKAMVNSQSAPQVAERRGGVPVGHRPLRICQVVPYDLAERGGVKHHAVQLARVLRSCGDEVTIVGPSSMTSSDPHTVPFSGVVNIKGNGSDNRLGLLVSPRRIWRFFREQRFDVVHIHEPLQPALPYWAIWFSRASAHVATFHAFSERTAPAVKLFGSFAARSFLNSFQVRMAVSAAAARSAARTWPQGSVVIPNGVSTEVFAPRPGPRIPGPVSLLFVGRLGDARKGFRYLDTAFRRLRARGVNVTLDVVGELGGSEPPPAIPGLTYHGSLPVEQLVERYQRADLFVAPSTGQESFGIVLLEAMGVGLPVICSDIDGYRETIAPEGALLTAPSDAGDLERAISVLVANPQRWQKMGEVNRRRADLFDWKVVATQIREQYGEALRMRGTRRPRVKAIGAPQLHMLAGQGPALRGPHDSDGMRRLREGPGL